jgi:hypothetical protein
MKVYLDENYIAHAEYTEGYIEAESSFFDMKAPELFPCYRFIPAGYTWQREDGEIFEGEAISLVNPTADMVSVQQAHEQSILAQLATAQMELADADEALHELGVEWEEEEANE